MDITYLLNRPRFRDRNKANVTTAGYLYFNSRLAELLGIEEGKRYKLGVIQKQGTEYPAIIEDPNGNKICKQHKGFVLYMKNLKDRYNIPGNQKINLEKFSVKKTKGFLLVKADSPEWITYN